MNIFVYSDESGVFDKKHNKYFIYGGLIILSKEEKENALRLYKNAEKVLRETKYKNCKNLELKACKITNKEKSQLFRSLNRFIKFSIIIDQEKVLDRIFKSKKDKQRYLDYAYKVGLKKIFKTLIKSKKIVEKEVENIYFFVDEHTTATNGRYELQEALENEFKNGTYNYEYNKYFEPIFTNIKSLEVKFCNSINTVLVRAADIVANKVYYYTCSESLEKIDNKILVEKLP